MNCVSGKVPIHQSVLVCSLYELRCTECLFVGQTQFERSLSHRTLANHHHHLYHKISSTSLNRPVSISSRIFLLIFLVSHIQQVQSSSFVEEIVFYSSERHVATNNSYNFEFLFQLFSRLIFFFLISSWVSSIQSVQSRRFVKEVIIINRFEQRRT